MSDTPVLTSGENVDSEDVGFHVSTFSVLYESADERFALYELFDGHLVAIDTSKLA